MNAPTPPRISPQAQSAARVVREIVARTVELWNDGRSIAGIVMELEAEFGLEISARRCWQRIQERRKAGHQVRPALYTPADYMRAQQEGEPLSLLDQRADNTQEWEDYRVRQFMRSAIINAFTGGAS